MAPTMEELDLAIQVSFAAEAKDLLRQVERALHGLVGGDPAERGPRCRDMLRGLHTLKGAAAAAGRDAVARGAHALEDQVRGVQEGRTLLEGAGLDALFAGLEHVYEVLGPGPSAPAFEEQQGTPGEGPAPKEEVEELLRVAPSRVEALHALTGELVLGRLRRESLARRLLETRDRLGEAMDRWRELGARLEPCKRTLPRAQWAGVKAARDACGPAMTSAWKMLSAVAREAPALLAHTAGVEGELEEGIRELRLMPLQPFLEEYARVAREAARACGKDVRLEVRAAGAEVDRGVLMRLRDVLLHLVRNAVVHGVESPERRRERGKPEAGTLTLEARCEGARAFLRVADDGAGVDVERVLQRARELDGGAAPRDTSPEALLALLSRPGFSTRDEVDALAGRGVGLDVVANILRGLEGQWRLEHVPGRGTAFLLEVPVSASTHRGLVVRVGEDSFGLLLHHVERVVRVGARDVTVLEGHATVPLDGQPVALVALASLLGLQGEGAPEGPKRTGVVVRQGSRRLVVLVDDVPGEERLVIKPLGPAFAGAPLVLGGALQADGSVLPVLQVPALLDRAAEGVGRGSASASLGPRSAPALGAVLVVDDSPTLRMLLRNVLRAAGFPVVVASDGLAAVEAWNRQPFSLVVTDLDMPLLDGAELCRFVRRSERPRTPVILVTSQTGAEARRRALDVGVDAYVVKGEFEQATFLRLVRKLTNTGEHLVEAAVG
ncbi:hybrid sensor histidine kinase/response regulator [Melittangium boletus]|uniref:histidine kinase n=1 Tax=Melittangium boletus DSM 14713 TaxID=1294270 RepID=A0A250IES8_9BACT|nr:response regulator [Melittangium boletus]ATB30265.1 signal transduction histidine kinase [Melittangium boletus DSM 14713]